MKKLIQNEEHSIVYGNFNGEENVELFRCPRALDEIDLKRYVNEYRDFFHLVNDDDSNKNNCVPDNYVGYYRLYFSGGWCGRWFGYTPSKIDCHGLDNIIEWLRIKFKHGCDYSMYEFLSHFDNCQESRTRHFLKPYLSDKYKIMFETAWGNGDYPVRIYVYK